MSKHEVKAKRLAKKLLENKFNASKTYKEYHNTTQEIANKNAYKCMERYGTYERALAILEETDDLKLDEILRSLKDDLKATKPIINKGRIEYIRDNGIVLDAKKFILSKLYQLETPSITDNRTQSIHINLDQAQIDKLEAIVNIIKELSSKQVISGEIT